MLKKNTVMSSVVSFLESLQKQGPLEPLGMRMKGGKKRDVRANSMLKICIPKEQKI